MSLTAYLLSLCIEFVFLAISSCRFIILEHIEGGELFDYLVSKGRLDLSEALIFFQQIVMGLEYCQSLLIWYNFASSINSLGYILE
jgi:serine/threonine protein kinase